MPIDNFLNETLPSAMLIGLRIGALMSFAPFFGGEGPFDGALEVTHRTAVEAHHAGQAGALLRQLPLNLFLGRLTGQFIQRKIDVSHRHGNVLFM